MKLAMLVFTTLATLSTIHAVEAATKRQVLGACKIVEDGNPAKNCNCDTNPTSGRTVCITMDGSVYDCPIKGQCTYIPPKAGTKGNGPTFEMILKNPGKFQ